jgi:hypothetical protein
MVNNPTSPAGDEIQLKMVEQVKAYFLTQGTIVQVTEEDPSSGLSKIRMAGITVDLWTLTRFLSKHAVKDTYGVIETPETSPSAAWCRPSESDTMSYVSDDRFLWPDHVGMRQRNVDRSRQRVRKSFNCYPPTTRGVAGTPKKRPISRLCVRRCRSWDMFGQTFSVAGEKQDKATEVLLKRFAGNLDVEKAKVDFDRAQEVEERFHYASSGSESHERMLPSTS